MTLRLAFMGSPAFAVPALRALHGAGHQVVAVYSQPPRPAGRGMALQPCPVQAEAERLGLPVTGVDAKELHALVLQVLVDLLECVRLGAARPAPMYPDVHHDDVVAAFVGQRVRAATEQRARQVWRRLAIGGLDERGCRVA